MAERIKGVEGCYLADPAPDDLATKLEWVAGRGERTKGRAIIEDLSVERVAERLRTFYDQVRLAWGARQAVD